jgi:hypothetical protein
MLFAVILSIIASASVGSSRYSYKFTTGSWEIAITVFFYIPVLHDLENNKLHIFVG